MRSSIAALLCLLLVAGCITLGGCGRQSREVDATLFYLAVGVDEAEDGEYDFSYQASAARPSEGEGGGGGMPSPPLTEVITIRASSSAEARSLIKSIAAPVPNVSHAKLLVVSEKLARHGLKGIVGPLVRFKEYRGTMFIVVCRGSAKDFLKANQPKSGANPAKYYEEMMVSSGASSFYPASQLHRFYLAMKSHSSQPYAAYAAVNPASGKGQGEKPVPGGMAREYVAGSIPRSGGNAIEFAGTAVFRADKMVGTLTTQETRALAIMKGQFPLCYYTVQDPLDPREVVLGRVTLTDKPKIDVAIRDGRPVFDIAVSLEGETLSVASGISYEKTEYRTLLEQQISNVFEEEINKFFRKTQELNADVAGLGYHLRPEFGTIDEFYGYNWVDKYRSADIRVKVKTVLRRNGLMRKTSPIIKPEAE